MRSRKLTYLAFACALLFGAAQSRGATTVGSFADIQNWVGTGTNQAALVIDWEDGKPPGGGISGQSLAWGYRWSDGQTPTGLDMIKAIAAADPRLDISVVVRGTSSGGTVGQTIFGIFYDLDGDGGTANFDPVNEYGTASDSDDHFAEGWTFNGYWSYYQGGPSSTQPGWTLSGTGAQNRALSNNSWDGWAFDDFGVTGSPKPGTAIAAAAIPEPGVIALVMLGGLAILRRR